MIFHPVSLINFINGSISPPPPGPLEGPATPRPCEPPTLSVRPMALGELLVSFPPKAALSSADGSTR